METQGVEEIVELRTRFPLLHCCWLLEDSTLITTVGDFPVAPTPSVNCEKHTQPLPIIILSSSLLSPHQAK